MGWSVSLLDTAAHYSDTEIVEIYGTGAVRSNAHLRTKDAYGIKLAANAEYPISQYLYNGSSFLLGAAFYFPSLPASATRIIGGYSALGTGFSQDYNFVRLNTDGSLSLVTHVSGADSVISTTPAGTVAAGSHVYIEFADYATPTPGDRGLILAVNGETLFDGASALFLAVTHVWFRAPADVDVYISGLYLLRGGSSKPNLLGPVWIKALQATSDGTYQQFTPSSGSDHYALVDEIPPNDSDYVIVPVTVGYLADSYNFADVGETDVLKAVYLAGRFSGIGNFFALAPDDTVSIGEPGLFSAPVSITYVGRGWVTTPATGLPLTADEIDDYEFGASSNDTGEKLSQAVLLVALADTSVPDESTGSGIIQIAQQLIEIAIPYAGDDSFIDILAWLKEDHERLLLFEIEWVDTGESPAVTRTEYVSNLGYVTYPGDVPADQSYPDLVTSVPTISMQVDEATQIGELVILNQADTPTSTGPYDAWRNYNVVGQEIRCYLGDRSWRRAQFRLFFCGTVSGVRFNSDGSLVLAIADRSSLLDKSTQYQAVYGRIFNAEPWYSGPDPHYKIDQVPGSSVSSVTDVRDNGIAVSFSLADSNREIQLSASPAGKVTFDADKESSITAGDVITNLVLDAGLSSDYLDTDSLDTASLAVGYYVPHNSSERFLDIINQVANAAGGYVHFDYAGLLRYYSLDIGGTPSVTLMVDDVVGGVAITEVREPAKTVKLGYRRNYSVQDADSLAGAVTDANRQLYSQEFSYQTASNTLTPTEAYPKAEDVQLDTLLADGTEALTEAGRRAEIRETRSYTVQFTMPYLAVFLQLGQPVSLDYPRYGFSGGHTAVVVGLEVRPDDDQTIVTLWTNQL